MATTNKNFRIKNGLEVSNAIGVGADGTSFGTTGQVLTSNGTSSPAIWVDQTSLATSTVKHQVKLGEAIAKGQAVYISTATGANMIASKASNATEGTSSKTMGLLETGGVLNDQVNVITEGMLDNIDVGSASAGDPVWLGTSGNLIYGLTNKPIAPAHLVFIGIVTKTGTAGRIFIRPQNGFELNEIHNVLIGTDYTANSIPADNEVLAYDYGSSLWINQTAEEANIANTANTGTVTFAGNVTVTSGKQFNGNAAGLTSIPAGNLTGTAANIVYTTTTSLPNVTSVNSTTIPNGATLLTTSNIGSTVQAYDADLASIAGLTNSTGYLYNNGSGTFSYATTTDTNTTYTFGATGTSTASLTLTPSSGSTNTVTITGAGGTVVAQASNAITLTSPQVYTQTTQPSGGNVGDIWIDTDSSVTTPGIGYVPAGGPTVYTSATNTSDYSTTYTPAAGTRAIRFTVVGGGGGGAGVNSTEASGGGGGAGAYAMTWTTAIAASYTITVGGAGAGGTGGSVRVGGNGNTSSVVVTSNSAVIASAPGGVGATATSSDPGDGGVSGVGTIASGGGDGSPGGIAAGNTLMSGTGGASFFGGGGKGGAAPGNATGGTAKAYGAGGGGARYSNANRDGGPGKAGIVIIEEFM